MRTQGTNFRALAADTLLAQHLFDNYFNPKVQHIYKANGKRETVDSVLKGPDHEIWNTALSNEWGRLAQGNQHGVKSTDTIEFIPKTQVPSNKSVTYATFVLDY